MVTQAGKAVCAEKKRMRGLLALHLCIHGCTACSVSGCRWLSTPRPCPVRYSDLHFVVIVRCIGYMFAC